MILAVTTGCGGDSTSAASAGAITSVLGSNATATTATAESCEPADSSRLLADSAGDLLLTIEESTWEQRFRQPTGLAFQDAMALSAAVYDEGGSLHRGLTTVRLGQSRQVGVEGDRCAIELLEQRLHGTDIAVVPADERELSVPLTPDFEPVWRCDATGAVPIVSPEGLEAALDLQWGTEQTGTFLDGRLTLHNDGMQPFDIPRAATLLDVEGAGEIVGRYTAWLEPPAGLHQIPPGQSATMELRATSATAACTPPRPQHLPPGTYTVALEAPDHARSPGGRRRAVTGTGPALVRRASA